MLRWKEDLGFFFIETSILLSLYWVLCSSLATIASIMTVMGAMGAKLT